MVIVVPPMDMPSNVAEQSTTIMVSSGSIDGAHEHSICIETEADIEPASPKTMTESSSRFNYLIHFLCVLRMDAFWFFFLFFGNLF